jgi:plasmid stabilization system protein ParE
LRKVRLSPSAAAYVKSEAAYLKARSIPTARRFLDNLKLLKRNLVDFPHIGHINEETLVPGVFRFVMGEYVVDYEIVGDVIQLLVFRHSAQRPPDVAVDDDDNEDYEVK